MKIKDLSPGEEFHLKGQAERFLKISDPVIKYVNAIHLQDGSLHLLDEDLEVIDSKEEPWFKPCDKWPRKKEKIIFKVKTLCPIRWAEHLGEYDGTFFYTAEEGIAYAKEDIEKWKYLEAD